MYIKRLELQGFKTFPERTKILFNPGITIIIGPNGTGKSNIVEAIQWVLGGQRVRTVRGEKAEDAIFNGTLKRQLPLSFIPGTFSGVEFDSHEMIVVTIRLDVNAQISMGRS